MENKSLATVIVLSIVTCGVYAYVWMFKMLGVLIQENGETSIPKIGRFLLCFVYAGWIIFGIQADDQLNQLRAKKGLAAKDQNVLLLVLGIVCPIAMIAVFQNEINAMVA